MPMCLTSFKFISLLNIIVNGLSGKQDPTYKYLLYQKQFYLEVIPYTKTCKEKWHNFSIITNIVTPLCLAVPYIKLSGYFKYFNERK